MNEVSPRVSIIILNWNGWKDTIECLESLYQIIYPNYDVIVVDNGSEDDSIKKIKEYCEGKLKVDSKFFGYSSENKPIKIFEIEEEEARRGRFKRPLYRKYDLDRRLILIKNRVNYGFAGGNNVGIKFALSVLSPKYILLLNNDVVVQRNFLDELVKVAENYKRIGIVGPKIYYYDFDGGSNVIWFAGGKIDWSRYPPYYSIYKGNTDNEFFHNWYYRVDWTSGACILINTSIESPLLDDKFFFGAEDVDICIRYSKARYNIVSTPSAIVWHKAESSRKTLKQVRRLYIETKSNLHLINKYFKEIRYSDKILLAVSIITLVIRKLPKLVIASLSEVRLKHLETDQKLNI